MTWLDDPLEVAIREFCYGDGRAIPRSVFLAWPDPDQVAALEWLAYRKSLCPGCQRPRDESFDPSMDDAYEVVELRCHACFQRDMRAWNNAAGREPGEPPPLGSYYIVRPEAVPA